MIGSWLKAVALLSLLALAGTWWITRRLEHDLTEADAAIGAALSQAPTHELRLPVLGDEIERGIPAFVAQSRAAAAALAATSRAATG